MFTIKEFKKVDIKKSILIEGLPGIANVARISVDFLIDKLKAEKFMEIYSYVFPALVVIDEDSIVDLPKIELYHKKIGKNNLVFLIGDMQPSDEYNHRLCEKILEIIKPAKIITIGGIALQKAPKNPQIHVAATNKGLVKELKKYNVIFDGNETVSLIVGAAGVLLGLAKLRNIPAFALLVETLGVPTHFGIKSAKRALQFIDAYLNLNLDFEGLTKEIQKYEKEIKRRNKIEDELQEYLEKTMPDKESRYIG